MTTATADAPAKTTRKTKTTKGATKPPTDDRYADDATAKRLAAAVTAARRAGFSRAELTKLTGLTGAKLWRAERGRAHRDEVERLDAALGRIASGEVKPPERAAGRTSRTTQAVSALEAALAEKSLAGTKKLLREALDLLQPKIEKDEK